MRPQKREKEEARDWTFLEWEWKGGIEKIKKEPLKIRGESSKFRVIGIKGEKNFKKETVDLQHLLLQRSKREGSRFKMTNDHTFLHILYVYIELQNAISFLKYGFLLDKVYFNKIPNFEISTRY